MNTKYKIYKYITKYIYIYMYITFNILLNTNIFRVERDFKFSEFKMK